MRYRFFIPLVIFAIATMAFYMGLSLNPTQIPSAKIGKPVPEFTSPALYEGEADFTSADLSGQGYQLVNVFASWCVPCREEHPILMALKARGISINGLNYKDTPKNGRKFLETLGNPYNLMGQDLNGRIAINWGVSGVPETFLVNNDGKIIFQHIGPLTRGVVADEILPRIEGGSDD
jgi:cytochrome c biogenesis protein CcmG/thiol:disulfide interchange protein DsbE